MRHITIGGDFCPICSRNGCDGDGEAHRRFESDPLSFFAPREAQPALLVDPLDALRAENERLREALQTITQIPTWTCTGDVWDLVQDAADIAQKALDGGKP